MSNKKYKCPSCGYAERFSVVESIVHLVVPSEENPDELKACKVITNEIDACFCGNCQASIPIPEVKFT